VKHVDFVKRWAALIMAFAALVVALTGSAGAVTGNAGLLASTSDVVVVKATGSTIGPGEAGGKLVRCPSGYSVFSGAYALEGGSRAVPFVAGPLRKENGYEVDIANPPANPLAGLPGADAKVLVAAYCGRTGRPIVLPHFGG
jgi:hypothetical protein